MARKATVTNEQTATEAAVTANDTAAKPAAKKYKSKALSPHDYITVRNGFNGKLIYKSSKTGEVFIWDNFGDEQDMELQELKNAKNSHKAFFEGNYFLIDNPDVISYLGVERYYKNALSYDSFDSVFELAPAEIEERIALLSSGQKQSLVYRAKQKIDDGGIDSIKLINALEKALGVELIER